MALMLPILGIRLDFSLTRKLLLDARVAVLSEAYGFILLLLGSLG